MVFNGDILNMNDPRYTKLSDDLVNYSTCVKKGDVVLVEAIDVPDEFIVQLLRGIRKAGGSPLVEVRHSRITREMIRETTDTHAKLMHTLEMFRSCNCFLSCESSFLFRSVH